MEEYCIQVRENVGSGKVKVRILSKEKIQASRLEFMSNMTLNEAIRYGNRKGWKVLICENRP